MSDPKPASAISSTSPSRDDSETTPSGICPVCARAFTPTGRQRYCRPACRKKAHRRRHVLTIDIQVPAAVNRRDRTVYQCPDCESLQLGVQRCTDCGVFGRSLGLGGHCPHCQEPITMDDLDLTNT
jgi:predicted nucleic acid-binding Zn ribbon protein